MQLKNEPIFIIGAARSGTNMLRNVITKIPGYGTWPCDEINYIWRYGNRSKDSDEFTKKDLNPKINKFITNEFVKIQNKFNLEYVVEKTCANSLRVNFLRAIFPNAKYILITRDGRDVVSSAEKRWKAELDLNYIYQKAKYIPKQDILYYATNYFTNRISKIFSKEDSLATWGPRFKNIDEVRKYKNIFEISAIQWAKSVELSLEGLSNLSKEQFLHIQYEEFTKSPHHILPTLLRFLDYEWDAKTLEMLSSNVKYSSVGKWRSNLSHDTLNKISPLIDPMLKKLGYEL